MSGDVRVVAVWEAAPGRAEEVRTILRELAARSRAEPGCLQFDPMEAGDRPGSFVLVERYAGAAARAAHLASDHFAELVTRRAVPLLASRDVREYSVVGEARRAG